jgi:hypothetical protein
VIVVRAASFVRPRRPGTVYSPPPLANYRHNVMFDVVMRLTATREEEGVPRMRKIIVPTAMALGLALAVSGCTDPYDPGQRAVGGGLLGAGAGAAIGGIAGGGKGAAIGALAGGALGAVGGAATTPPRPAPAYGYAPPPPPPPPPPYGY